MNAFDPGEGWREVRSTDALQGRDQLVLYPNGGRTADRRYWVREDLMPPLPTVPYTVIRVTWKDGQPAKEYALIGGRWGVMRPDELAEQMAGFEVLSEPRAVTAKALLAELEDYFDGAWTPGHERLFSYDHERALFARLRTTFGASS